MLSVPMMVRKRLIGAINCYTTTRYQFSKSQVDLLSAVANQAAVAIENTELLVKAKVAERELEIRKKVERAKGILMKEQNIGEEEAYNLMRKSSMDKRLHMNDIAEAVILSYEVRKKNK